MGCRLAVFIGSSSDAIKKFPRETQKEIGWQLQAVQNGLNPEDWKPMPSIGSGVKELRIHQMIEYRVTYVAHFPEAVYVLNAFEKKSQRTAQRHINAARTAYAKVKKMRSERSRDIHKGGL
jgi:phage-related protein